MNASRTTIPVLLMLALLYPTSARGESAREAFARGKVLLARGNLQGALTSYGAAARADRTNRTYLGQYMLVRQAIEVRKRLETEQDPRRWEQLARMLHAFYASQGVYSESLALDRRIHAKLDSASSAVMLAETQLAMDLNAEAARTLADLEPGATTTSTRALLGVALAREDKMDQARQLAKTVVLPQAADPGTMYNVARLRAVTGNPAEALRLLGRCFESVAPMQLSGFKAHARHSPEFAVLASTAEFGRVLQTQSKVPQSPCSGGSKCAGCPLRGNCGKAGGR